MHRLYTAIPILQCLIVCNACDVYTYDDEQHVWCRPSDYNTLKDMRHFTFLWKAFVTISRDQAEMLFVSLNFSKKRNVR